jgi:hypothetical protein
VVSDSFDPRLKFANAMSLDFKLILDELNRRFDELEIRWDRRFSPSTYLDHPPTPLSVHQSSDASASTPPTPTAAVGVVVIADNWGGCFDDGEQYYEASSVVADNWGGLFEGCDAVADISSNLLDSDPDEAFVTSHSDKALLDNHQAGVTDDGPAATATWWWCASATGDMESTLKGIRGSDASCVLDLDDVATLAGAVVDTYDEDRATEEQLATPLDTLLCAGLDPVKSHSGCLLLQRLKLLPTSIGAQVVFEEMQQSAIVRDTHAYGVTVHVPPVCMLDGVHSQHFFGTGIIIYHSEHLGLVAVDRKTVVVSIAAILLSFAPYSIEISGEVVFLRPVHNFALLAYDPSALGAGASVVRAAKLLSGSGATIVEDQKVLEEKNAQNTVLLHPLLPMVDKGPWPPPVQLEIHSSGIQLRPVPWPSLYYYAVWASWIELMVVAGYISPKPPWLSFASEAKNVHDLFIGVFLGDVYSMSLRQQLHDPGQKPVPYQYLASYYGALLGCSWSVDGKYLLSVGDNDLVQVWSMNDTNIVSCGEGHNSWTSVMCMAFYAQSEETRQSHSVHKFALGTLAFEHTLSSGSPIRSEVELLPESVEVIDKDYGWTRYPTASLESSIESVHKFALGTLCFYS